MALQINIRDLIATITLNRPEELNLIDANTGVDPRAVAMAIRHTLPGLSLHAGNSRMRV